MARITIAALQAQLTAVITERDEALEALHRLAGEVLAARLAEQAALYAERPSRQHIAVEERRYQIGSKSFIKTRAQGTKVWTIREVQ